MQVVAARIRRPLVADKRRVMAGFVVFLGGPNGFFPGGTIGLAPRKRGQRFREFPLREGNDDFNGSSYNFV